MCSVGKVFQVCLAAPVRRRLAIDDVACLASRVYDGERILLLLSKVYGSPIEGLYGRQTQILKTFVQTHPFKYASLVFMKIYNFVRHQLIVYLKLFLISNMLTSIISNLLTNTF